MMLETVLKNQSFSQKSQQNARFWEGEAPDEPKATEGGLIKTVPPKARVPHATVQQELRLPLKPLGNSRPSALASVPSRS
jgi:hypothetical protein